MLITAKRIFLLSISFFFISQAQAYTITQITNNAVDASYVSITDNSVFWTVSDSDSFNATPDDLFVYDIATQVTTQLTSGQFVSRTYQTNSRGDALWTNIGSSTLLHYYDSDTGLVQDLSSAESITDALLADNGDVVLVRGSVNDATISTTIHYDATTGISTVLPNIPAGAFVNLTDINASGDVAGSIVIGNETYAFVYYLATQSFFNISAQSFLPRPVFSRYSVIADNGNVVWSQYADITNYDLHVMYYTRATQTTSQISNDPNAGNKPQFSTFRAGGAQINANGDVVYGTSNYVVGIGNAYDLTLYNAVTMQSSTLTNEIANDFSFNDRGDVVWVRSISTDVVGVFYYNSVLASSSIIAQHNGSVYANLSQNGDVTWNSVTYINVAPYYTDAATFIYDGVTLLTTQLTGAGISDFNTPSINAAGDTAWSRWGADGNGNQVTEVILAQKVVTTPVVLDITVTEITEDDDELKVEADFSFSGTLADTDVISASADGIELFSVVFSDFDLNDGVYEYDDGDIVVELDLITGDIKVDVEDFDIDDLSIDDGINVSISFGSTTGSDNYLDFND